MKHSSLASVSATRERLAELGLSTKKSLGQHFLIDDGVVGKILRLAALQPGSEVLEVGPGIGTLTEALLSEHVQLTAVELDSSLHAGLARHYPSLNLIAGDALAPETIASLQNLAPPIMVANLPYAVAATIILEYFQVLPSLQTATVMVQREVAERIAAQPGSKAYGAYTVKLGLLAKTVEQFGVSPQCFYPPPRVDSAVIRLERTRPYNELLATASMLADAAFFQRRKTIKNSMQAYLEGVGRGTVPCLTKEWDKEPSPAPQVSELLAAAQIDPTCRGETLSSEEFLNLAHIIS